MNYTNFTKKFVKDYRTTFCSIAVHEHNNGTQCTIDNYDENFETQDYVTVTFNSSKTIGITMTNEGVIKIYTDNDYRERDLSSHPSWNRSRGLLVRIYLHHILSRILTNEELEALRDYVNFNFEVLDGLRYVQNQ